MLRSSYSKYLLQFKVPAGTSRGILQYKEAWFIKIWDEADPARFGIGECAVFRGLSMDDRPGYESKLKDCCQRIKDQEFLENELMQWPSIKFGIETAMLDLHQGGTRLLHPSPFTAGQAGIPINGLIWMGETDFIKQQIKQKLEAGFRCIKIKIGALQVQEELDLLRMIRKSFHPDELELRLDANGAFAFKDVFEVLEQFSRFTIHSIEQPIKTGFPDMMEQVCRQSPIPVALDEELIGKTTLVEKTELLTHIKPQYIIVKPALTGGFSGALEWISEARALNIGWWVTSALESNIGLNAIAQWAYSLQPEMVQGLGTGSLYTNNIPSPLYVSKQELCMDSSNIWDLSNIEFHEGKLFY